MGKHYHLDAVSRRGWIHISVPVPGRDVSGISHATARIPALSSFLKSAAMTSPSRSGRKFACLWAARIEGCIEDICLARWRPYRNIQLRNAAHVHVLLCSSPHQSFAEGQWQLCVALQKGVQCLCNWGFIALRLTLLYSSPYPVCYVQQSFQMLKSRKQLRAHNDHHYCRYCPYCS